MKVMIQEIEEFEVTDPSGLCNPPVPRQGQPTAPHGWPTPQNPGTHNPWPGVVRPGEPAIYTTRIRGRTKWGVGGPMIQGAGENMEKEKWEKNWQANMEGEVPADGSRNTS